MTEFMEQMTPTPETKNISAQVVTRKIYTQADLPQIMFHVKEALVWLEIMEFQQEQLCTHQMDWVICQNLLIHFRTFKVSVHFRLA